jgi:predicted alpha/beta superfamily hydrolase
MNNHRPHVLLRSNGFELSSRATGRTYYVSVALPATYDASDRPYPALVVLDGNLAFDLAVGVARLLPVAKEVRELIVIGVGCSPEATAAEFSTRRLHEFSPTDRWNFEADEFGRSVKAIMDQMGLKPSGAIGGAPRFLDFLIDELLPLLYRDYRIDPAELGLFGDSAGGTFVLYALLSGRSPFKKYICGSPATAYCNDELYRMEERYAAANRDLDAQLFLAAGAEEMNDSFLEASGIVSGVARFTGIFRRRRYFGFRLTSCIFPGEGHLSAVPAILSRGIATLWSTHRSFGDSIPTAGG